MKKFIDQIIDGEIKGTSEELQSAYECAQLKCDAENTEGLIGNSIHLELGLTWQEFRDLFVLKCKSVEEIIKKDFDEKKSPYKIGDWVENIKANDIYVITNIMRDANNSYYYKVEFLINPAAVAGGATYKETYINHATLDELYEITNLEQIKENANRVLKAMELINFR